jgi:hypothetical protein
MMTTRYIDAVQAYRSERMSIIQSTWLNTRIPWKVFVTLNTLNSNTGGNSETVLRDVITVMLKMAGYRNRCLISAAVAYEQFPGSPDMHSHLVIGSEKELQPTWFDGYLNRFQEIRHKVLPYSSPEILSYVLKTTETELINCEPYLKPPANAQERRRLRRMQQRQNNAAEM